MVGRLASNRHSSRATPLDRNVWASTCLSRREGWSDAGLLWFGTGQQRRWEVYLAAYLLPILIFLLGSGLALLTGIQPGYLLPDLLPLGAIPASLLIGVIWGLWHAPVFLLDGFEYGVRNSWISVGIFVLFVTSLSFPFTWLRLRSGSIWSRVLAHAVINTVAPMLFVFLTRTNLYEGVPDGLLAILSFLGFALWLITTRRLQVDRDQRA